MRKFQALAAVGVAALLFGALPHASLGNRAVCWLILYVPLFAATSLIHRARRNRGRRNTQPILVQPMPGAGPQRRQRARAGR